MFYSSVVYYLGWLCLTFAGAMAVPMLGAFATGNPAAAGPFLGAILLAGFFGGASVLSLRGAPRAEDPREWFLLPALAWIVLPLFGALPFYFSAALPSLGDAYFEAVSGLTTTGTTLLTGLDQLPGSLLLWRAMLQWMGGLGTIVLAVTLLSLLGIGGMEIFNSAVARGEGEAMFPRMRRVARDIWWIYLALTLLCAVCLWAVGLPLFDALCHAMSTLSTGGFSTRDGSIGAFGNPLAEVVLIFFMAVGAVNFTLHWAFVRGNTGVYGADPEVRYFAFLALGAGLLLWLGLWLGGTAGGGGALAPLRNGLFAAVSALSTTGFTVGESLPFPVFPGLLLLTLMLIGGATGSTAGGLKLMRFFLLFKHSNRELNRLAHPHGVMQVRHGEHVVAEPVMLTVWAYLVVLLAANACFTLALAWLGMDFKGALVAATAAISNAGPAAGFVLGGPEAVLPVGGKWVICIAMLFGRLELFTLLTLISPSYWRS